MNSHNFEFVTFGRTDLKARWLKVGIPSHSGRSNRLIMSSYNNNGSEKSSELLFPQPILKS